MNISIALINNNLLQYRITMMKNNHNNKKKNRNKIQNGNHISIFDEFDDNDII